MNEIKNYTENAFESIKHIDGDGCEFWYARELQKVLEYKEWRKFNSVIDKAMNSCLSSKNNVFDHFVQLDKMIHLAKGAKRKGLRYRENILDNMGSDELSANLFRISQTNQKLKNDSINNEVDANNTHYYVGSKVRQTIKKLGGTMPEDLPTPKNSLKQLEKERKSFLE